MASNDLYFAWFIIEILYMIVIVMGGVGLLWIYTPLSIYIKLGITILSSIIVYDVFRSFVYAKYIVWKESRE